MYYANVFSGNQILLQTMPLYARRIWWACIEAVDFSFCPCHDILKGSFPLGTRLCGRTCTSYPVQYPILEILLVPGTGRVSITVPVLQKSTGTWYFTCTELQYCRTVHGMQHSDSYHLHQPTSRHPTPDTEIETSLFLRYIYGILYGKGTRTPYSVL